jgi:hypothetical protein
MAAFAAVALCGSRAASADDTGARERTAAAESAHETALRLARAGDFLGAARASDRAIAEAPGWAEAHFVRAGILTRLGRARFDPKQPVRRGVDYAGAAKLLAGAHEDLRRYLAQRPWAENRAGVEIALKQLAELARAAASRAETIRAWDAHRYPVRGWVECRAGAYKAFWFEVDGTRVTSLPAGEHRITLRTQDCGTRVRVVSMPPYTGEPRSIDLSFVLEPPGPGQLRVDASLSAALEVVHAAAPTLLRDVNGSEVGATFSGGATLFGGHVKFTGRDRGGWRWRWALNAELGLYRGEASVSSYRAPSGEPSVNTGNVGLTALRGGVGLRLHQTWNRLRLFASAGLAIDRWQIDVDGVSAVSMLRAPIAVGFEAVRTCRWRPAARVQVSPTLPTEDVNTFGTFEVSAGVSRAWCGSGRGITMAAIGRLMKTGAAARRSIAFGIGVDRVQAGDDFSMRRQLLRGDNYGASFTGGTTVTGPTLHIGPAEIAGRRVRVGLGITAGYYRGRARLVQYTPKPGSGEPSIGGLPRNVDVHAYRFTPRVSLRFPLGRVIPFASVGIATELWGMSEGDNAGATAFRLPLTAGLELVKGCALRVRLHAGYAPGVVLGVQEDFATTQFGAAVAYALCSRY